MNIRELRIFAFGVGFGFTTSKELFEFFEAIGILLSPRSKANEQ